MKQKPKPAAKTKAAAPRTKNLTAAEVDRLVMAAHDARGRAYAPYSKYNVGAALLTDDGRIFGGCNVENSSYGLTLCAERGAIASAISSGHQQFRAIAVATEDIGSPCGACRQFLVEFNPDMLVILADVAGKRKTFTARELLPEFFLLDRE